MKQKTRRKPFFPGLKYSVKSQFIFLIVIIIILLLFVISFLSLYTIQNISGMSQQISSEALETQAEEYMIAITQDNAKKNDLFLSEIKGEGNHVRNICNQIFSNPDVFTSDGYWDVETHIYQGEYGQYLNDETELGSVFLPNTTMLNQSVYETLGVSAYMDFFVPVLVENNSDIVAIYLGTKHEITRYYPNIMLGTVIPPDFQVTQRPWYLTAVKNNTENNVVFSSVYTDATGKGFMITAASPVHGVDDEFIGVLGMDVTLDAITSMVQETTFLGDGYFCLFDDHYQVITMPDKGYDDLFNLPANDENNTPLLTDISQINSSLDSMTSEQTVFTTVSINGPSFLMTLYKMHDTGWILAGIAEKDTILSSISTLQRQNNEMVSSFLFHHLVPLGIVVILIASLLSILLINRVTHPISQLSYTANKIAKGDFNSSIPTVNRHDEIGSLSQSFSHMIYRLKEYQNSLQSMNQVLEEKVEQRTNELHNKVSDLEKAEEANLSLLEDLQSTIVNLKQAKREIFDKNVELENAKKSLEQLTTELEQRVAERTNKIGELLKQKDEFINQLGHDLKNPLNPLLNLIPFLEKDETDDKRKKVFETLKRNTQHMKNLVTKTIQLAKLNKSNTELSFEETNLLQEINDVIEKNKLFFNEHNIEIENKIDNNLMVQTDKLRLTELFDNLLNNAVKYTEGSGKIVLDAESSKDVVTVSITDTGIGMTREQLKHIFDEFYKADNSRHDFDSSGLGLPICHRIVEKHGGRIWAESEGLGKGSTFYFTLPLANEQKKYDEKGVTI